MSVFRRLAIQGGVAVLRDSEGKVVASTPVKPHQDLAENRSKRPKVVKQETWRSIMRKLTNNGQAQMQVLHDLSMGVATQVELPDGRVSEPIVPSPEVRRAASVDLIHLMHGKPVAQTEVVRAEREAEDLDAYNSIGTEDLESFLHSIGWEKASDKRKALSGVAEGDEDDE